MTTQPTTAQVDQFRPEWVQRREIKLDGCLAPEPCIVMPVRDWEALERSRTARDELIEELRQGIIWAPIGAASNADWKAPLIRKINAVVANRPLDMSGQTMGDPHPLDLAANGQCPICGGFDGDHKPGCEDGSERL